MNETDLQEIKCITLTGENVVISAAHFDALLSTVRELQRQNDELTNVVGMCRAAAGWGTDADPMNVQSWAAMGDPADVSVFIKSQFERLQRQAQERDRLLEDAHQELLGNECGSPELHHAIQDVLIESEQAALNKEQPNE
jgi:hypothetical protein